MTSVIAALTFGGSWNIHDKTLLIPHFPLFQKNKISWRQNTLI